MSLAVRVVCRAASAPGFRLAGMPVLEADDAAEGARLLARELDDPAVGVLLVEQPVYDAAGESLQRELARRPLPMVVPFPGPAWEAPAAGPEAFIAELLRQAIGYRVRLE